MREKVGLRAALIRAQTAPKTTETSAEKSKVDATDVAPTNVKDK